jgi:hypothetical protein
VLILYITFLHCEGVKEKIAAIYKRIGLIHWRHMKEIGASFFINKSGLFRKKEMLQFTKSYLNQAIKLYTEALAMTDKGGEDMEMKCERAAIKKEIAHIKDHLALMVRQ